LYQNLDALIKRRGIEHIGMTCLTFAENLTDRREAQRRFNGLASHFFRSVPDFEYIFVPERQERGAIHYHIPVALPWNIREGFDFASLAAAIACQCRGDAAGRRAIEISSHWFNACPALRQWWHDLNEACKKYGFGYWDSKGVLHASRNETFPR